MNVSIDNRLFEWDDEKAELNWQKHRVRFETAARVFSDDAHIIEFDDEHSDYEDRWKIIGKVDDVLFVIYTERGEFTRLISARKASATERRKYYAGTQSY